MDLPGACQNNGEIISNVTKFVEKADDLTGDFCRLVFIQHSLWEKGHFNFQTNRLHLLKQCAPADLWLIKSSAPNESFPERRATECSRR